MARESKSGKPPRSGKRAQGGLDAGNNETRAEDLPDIPRRVHVGELIQKMATIVTCKRDREDHRGSRFIGNLESGVQVAVLLPPAFKSNEFIQAGIVLEELPK